MEKMSHDKNLFDRIEDLKTIQEHERIILNFNRGIFDRNKAIEALLKFKAACSFKRILDETIVIH